MNIMAGVNKFKTIHVKCSVKDNAVMDPNLIFFLII